MLVLFAQGVSVQGVSVLGGKCPGGKCPGGKCPGGICPWGKCPGGTCPGGLCPRTILNVYYTAAFICSYQRKRVKTNIDSGYILLAQ